MKQPPWLMPTASGPLRAKSHCSRCADVPQRAQVVVGRDRLAALENQANLQMVLQVRSHARCVTYDGDAMLAQQRLRADA